MRIFFICLLESSSESSSRDDSDSDSDSDSNTSSYRDSGKFIISSIYVVVYDSSL